MPAAALAVGGRDRRIARPRTGRGARPARLGRARARALVCRQRRFRLLSCRRRAALVRRPERLHRRLRRCDDTRTDEAADPRHGAGPVRPPGLDIVRGVLGRLEPARVADHDRLLRCRASACPWSLAARARRQSSSARGCMTSNIPGRPPYLPGDRVPEGEVERMIRVDYAGEYGAVRIYEGQLAVMRRGRARDAIRRMAEQEARHLATFNQLMQSRRVRPTVLQPLWHIAGFALGAATALLGEQAAMACTVAVEEVIDEHYREQAERLGGGDLELASTISEFHAHELEHRAVALEHGARETPGYDLIA